MEFSIEGAREYINTVRWQYAKTMPDWPHEYTVKDWRPDLVEQFEACCRLIDRSEFVEPWPPPSARAIYHNHYLAIDGHKYWAMGPRGDQDPPEQKDVINRAAVTTTTFSGATTNEEESGYESPAMIDASFDLRTDASGQDPDLFSPTLRRYHQLLWSKPLIQPIIKQLSEMEIEAFQSLGYTIGGMIIFPGNRIDRKQTINAARGFHPKIADRLDLTLECIRRHYRSEASPLSDTLQRYRDFFSLFEDFHGYVDFFLLHDLVTDAFDKVTFFLPFDDFSTPSVPKDVDDYKEYRRRSMEFVTARNRRIDSWVDSKDW